MKIGIDPDVDKSGIAIIQSNKLRSLSMSLIEMYEWFKLIATKIEVVKIEASWTISHNWTAKGSVAASLKIANHTGANHQIGKEIVKICEKLNINYRLIRPLKKNWKGANGKITHKELIAIWQVQKLKFEQTKTNQEERDAILLIL
jgi:hypothetical protein